MHKSNVISTFAGIHLPGEAVTIDVACNNSELNLNLSSFSQSDLLHVLEYTCSEQNSNTTIHGSINNPHLQDHYYVSINPQLSDGTECVVRGCYGDSGFSHVYFFESGSNGGKNCTTGKNVMGVCTRFNDRMQLSNLRCGFARGSKGVCRGGARARTTVGFSPYLHKYEHFP